MLRTAHASRRWLGSVCLVAVVCLTLASPVSCPAAIVPEGDVNLGYEVAVGQYSFGKLTITPPSFLSSERATIGEYPGSYGEVILDGATWSNSNGDTYVGQQGSGKLTLENGAQYLGGNSIVVGSSPSVSGEVNVIGPGTSLQAGDYQGGMISIGVAGGSGALNITHGGEAYSSWAVVGSHSGSGTAVISGTDSEWITGEMRIGIGGGSGSLYINDGGHLTSNQTTLADEAGGSAFIHIDGVGSSWTAGLSGWQFGMGRGVTQILLTDGASLNSWGPLQLGAEYGSFARVWIDGVGTSWNRSGDGNSGFIGEDGTGQLWITGGAVHTTAMPVSVGGASGEVLIDGHGSAWIATRAVTIGTTGPGRISVLNGAQLQIASDNLTINPGSEMLLDEGKVSIDTRSIDNQGVISGGGSIHGRLNNEGQIRVGQSDRLVMNGQVQNDVGGRIDVTGGELDARDMFNNMSDGTLNAEDALLRFNNSYDDYDLRNEGYFSLTYGYNRVYGNVENSGQTIVTGNSQAMFYNDVENSGEFTVSAGSTTTFLGEVTGNGIDGEGTIIFEGGVAPGSSPGLMDFAGDVRFGTLSGLAIELAGTEPGTEFDQLNIAGDAHLAGTLTLDTLAPVTDPGGSVELAILTAGSFTGMFSDAPQPGDYLGNGVTFDGIQYDNAGGNVLVSLSQAISGDLNIDGIVDEADLARWQAGFGTIYGADFSNGDADFDGDVDLADLMVIQQAFLGAVPAVAVPEPCSPILLAAALPWFLRRRRQPIDR